MEANISANTLFHYTSSQSALLSILKNGFYVRYSLENFDRILSGSNEIVLPMTCFCDIPLSQVKRHSLTYGNYAIGLTKDWGMRMKVNPVIYTYPHSIIAKLLNRLNTGLDKRLDNNIDHYPEYRLIRKHSKMPKEEFDELIGVSQVGINDDGTALFRAVLTLRNDKLSSDLSYFLKYVKPYEGKFYRNGGYMDKPVRFYDEREWRFVPPDNVFSGTKRGESIFSKKSIKMTYSAEYFKDPVKRRAINIKLASRVKLEFTPGDIKFIIVKRDSEIPSIIDSIDKIFSATIPYSELRLLYSRIMSLEQILEDF